MQTTGERNSWSGGGDGVGCDVQLVSLRGLRGSVGPGAAAGAAAAMTLRRAAVDCAFPPPHLHCDTNGGKVLLSIIDVRRSSFYILFVHEFLFFLVCFLLTVKWRQTYPNRFPGAAEFHRWRGV